MPLDGANFISELSITDPPGTDPLSQGDDQIRTIKRATFQSFEFVDAAVTRTAAQLNNTALLSDADPLTRAFLTDLAVRSAGDLDTEARFLTLTHLDGTIRGSLGHDGGPNLELFNRINSGNLQLFAANSVGAKIPILDGDPDGVTTVSAVTSFAWNSGVIQRMTLSAAGALVCDADVTAFSDERLKENLEVIPNALEKIQQLSGYTFNRIDHFDADGNNLDPHRHAGVLAQEVLKVLPEVITANEQGILGTAYGNLAALFIEAIKELDEKIDKLQVH